VIVLSIGFIGVLPPGTLALMMLGHWMVKVLYETAATPFTYLIVAILEKRGH